MNGSEEVFGGAEGDRTPDLMNAIHALSQLSYGPVLVSVTVNVMIEENLILFKPTSPVALFAQFAFSLRDATMRASTTKLARNRSSRPRV